MLKTSKSISSRNI